MAQQNLGPDRGPSLSDVAELADLLAEASRRLSEQPRFVEDPPNPPESPGFAVPADLPDPLPQHHDLIDVRPSALMGVDEGGRA